MDIWLYIKKNQGFENIYLKLSGRSTKSEWQIYLYSKYKYIRNAQKL